jgi:hypothetical protein
MAPGAVFSTTGMGYEPQTVNAASIVAGLHPGTAKATAPIHPHHQGKLEWQPKPEQPGGCGAETVNDHVNMDGQDCKERNQSPPCQVSKSRDQDTNSSKDLSDPADGDQFGLPWDVWQHDAPIEIRGDEMIQARANEEDSEQNSQCELHEPKTGYRLSGHVAIQNLQHQNAERSPKVWTGTVELLLKFAARRFRIHGRPRTIRFLILPNLILE